MNWSTLISLSETGGGITDNGIMGTTMTMLAAGIDTTSAETEWVMVELARHPKVLQRLHTEIDSVVGTERPLQESDLQHMPYLTAVLLKALRLHPVIPMTFPHVSKQESIIGKHCSYIFDRMDGCPCSYPFGKKMDDVHALTLLKKKWMMSMLSIGWLYITIQLRSMVSYNHFLTNHTNHTNPRNLTNPKSVMYLRK